MKAKLLFSLFILLLFGEMQAQDIKINFKGTGAANDVDSVTVENLTQDISITLSGTDTLHLSGSVGIPEIINPAGNGLHIYPNPAAGICNITIDAREQGPASIFLLNIAGELILHERVNLSEGGQTFSLSDIDTGIYLIRVESDSYSYTSRLISMNQSSGIPKISHAKSGSGSGKLKNHNSSIDFAYSTGDILKITGKSGVYRTVMMMVPTQNQTVSFDFINCTDAANNHYSVVKIGDQIWMAENLRTTRYRNGDAIPGGIANAAWGNLRTGAFSWYNQDSVKYAQVYGGLYNWYSVNDPRSIAPEGWHVPTDAEWTALSACLGGVNYAGGMMKENGYKHWRSPNSRATNETGFTALPGGYRFQNGTYDEIKTWCVWWCSTSSGSTLAPTRAVFYNSFELGRDLSDKRDGFTIRCVRD